MTTISPSPKLQQNGKKLDDVPEEDGHHEVNEAQQAKKGNETQDKQDNETHEKDNVKQDQDDETQAEQLAKKDNVAEEKTPNGTCDVAVTIENAPEENAEESDQKTNL